MRRPLVSVALALAAGVLVSSGHFLSPAASLAFAAAFGVAGLLLLFLHAPPRWSFAATLAALVAGGAAFAGSRFADERAPQLSALLSAGTRILHARGIVCDCPVERRAPRPAGTAGPQVFTRFTLELTQLSDGDRWSPIRGRLRVIVRGPADVQYGDEIEATLRAGRLLPPGNPGEEDVRLLMDRSGICGVAEVRSPDGILRTGEVRGLPGLRQVFGLRSRLLGFLKERMPGGDGRIVRCLVLGDQDAPTQNQRRAFRETGTMHFLAISGLHVALLAACCWWTLGAFGVGLRTTSIAVFLVALTFALLSGFEHGVQRSVVMCGVYCGAYLLARRMDFPSGMALAFILILLIRPADLYSIGLQLSFAAVLGMWLFARPLEYAIFGPPSDPLTKLGIPEGRSWPDYFMQSRFKSIVCVVLVVWLTTAPLIAQRFGMFTPIAPIASLLLFPLLPVSIVAGMAGALLGLFSAFAAQPLLWLAGGCAQVLEWACRAAARLPGVCVYLPPPGWAMILLCGAVFTAMAYRAKLGLTRRRVAALMLVPAFAYLLFVWPQSSVRHLRVDAISVGHGNCILTRFPDGRSLLFDAGSAGRADDIAERVIVPALWSLGVRRLDLLVLSHGDADHYNGTEELARRMHVGGVVVTNYFDYFDNQPGPKRLLETLSNERVPVSRFSEGDRAAGFAGAEIQALWPPPSVPELKWTANELCAVVRVRTPEGVILLTGDFGHGSAGPLIRRNPDLAADVLQVPHHGRADPDAAQLAEAVRPAVAIIPGGRDAQAAPFYARTSKNLLATDDCGMISVELNGGEPRIATYRNRRLGD
jgi:competence protein ComEC